MSRGGLRARPIEVWKMVIMRDKAGKVIPKAHLPIKMCPVCGRPFTWRKRWRECWEAVVYCSDACRSKRSRCSG
ncbi:MAG: hypothetical protein RL648_282 [Verrucomicrobiota bacterium]